MQSALNFVWPVGLCVKVHRGICYRGFSFMSGGSFQKYDNWGQEIAASGAEAFGLFVKSLNFVPSTCCIFFLNKSLFACLRFEKMSSFFYKSSEFV